MSRSYWCIILAFAGLISSGAQSAPEPQAKSELQQRQTQQNKTAPISNITPPKSAEKIQASEKRKPCGNGRYTSNDDLCAQWKAADAARDAADWAWWQLGLSALGVLGLGATLWFNFRALKLAESASEETRGALTIAERNAEAATNLVKVAEDTARRQLRAYVKFTIPNEALTIEVGKPIAITVKMINCGLTPAMNGSFRHAVGIADASWKWDGDVPDRTKDIAVNIHQNEPYRSQILSTFNFTNELAKSIFEQGHLIFARGTFHYDDVFGHEHVTQISIEIGKYELETGQLRVARYGNVTT